MIPKPESDFYGKVNGQFYLLQKAELIALRKAKLIDNAAFIHLTLRYENSYCDHPIEIFPKQFAKRWELPESSVYEAIDKLKTAGFLPEWIVLKKGDYTHTDTERILRDLLHQELGELTEVHTPSGRVDLLNEAEIIKFERIGDWKSALGQILVYSSFYPEHQKRIHLFGSASELERIADIKAACVAFDVIVTGEEVA